MFKFCGSGVSLLNADHSLQVALEIISAACSLGKELIISNL